MKKYRILSEQKLNGDITYYVQKCLWVFWYTLSDPISYGTLCDYLLFETLGAAKCHIEELLKDEYDLKQKKVIKTEIIEYNGNLFN